MFEYRLGLALGKSIKEVREIPYPEFREWMLFFMIEPWGFHDREYRTASLMVQQHNLNAKRGRGKKVSDFMRDLPKEVLKLLAKEKRKVEQQAVFDLETEEGKASATEHIIKMFESMFGNRVKRKDVK